eukprot:781728-Rhodomonas_salina.2
MRVEPRSGMPQSGTGRIPGAGPLNPGAVVPGGVGFRAGGAGSFGLGRAPITGRPFNSIISPEGNQHFHQTQAQAYEQQFYYQQEQEQLLYAREQNGDEEEEVAMYAGGRAAQLGQQFRDQAFISGYCFGSDEVLSSPYPG